MNGRTTTRNVSGIRATSNMLESSLADMELMVRGFATTANDLRDRIDRLRTEFVEHRHEEDHEVRHKDIRSAAWALYPSGSALSTGDGEYGVPVTTEFDKYRIIGALAVTYTAGVTGSTQIMIRRSRAGSDNDVFSSPLTLGDGEYKSTTCTINSSYSDLAVGDLLYFDIDQVHSGTAPNGLSVGVELAGLRRNRIWLYGKLGDEDYGCLAD